MSAPAFAIEIWLEKIGRPVHGPNGEVKASGEDLEAKGLTEYLWDVLYWSWACTASVSVLGERAWWLWAAIPLYSVWLGYTTFGGMRQGMAGLTGHQAEGAGDSASNRQRKMEKRGDQKVRYR